jgi:NAD(P)-dependent dehydrogenase (short-subunit alcohol dehydrogenase family)
MGEIMRLYGKIGVITAAGAGIGRASALRFAQEGATLGVVDIDAEKANAVEQEIRDAGGRAISIVGDLTDDDFARAIVPRTVEEFGGIDFLWNHAGGIGPKDIENVDLNELDHVINLTLRAGILATEAAMPVLKARRGNVLFTSSTSGLHGSGISFAYSMTKFGIVGMVRALAKRYAAEGVRFNAICPGPVETAMTIANRASSGWAGSFTRYGKPEEIAAGALFLVSDEASFVTGIALPVDGGYTA